MVCEHIFVEGQEGGRRGRFCLHCSIQAPEWTTTPPDEPGWYWYRPRPKRIQVVKIYADLDNIKRVSGMDGILPKALEYVDGEWWPIRIQEPE